MQRTLSCLTLCLFSSVANANAQPSDWPQWRGVARDGVSPETGLLQSWPEGGPALVWRATGLGGGYGAPAVQGGCLYGSGYRGPEEVVWALDASTGKELWSTPVAPAQREMGYPEGPRATPAIDADQLFTLGAGGNLVCLDTRSGELLWSTNLSTELGGEMMSEWGYSESPLVQGGLVLCTPGGERGSVAALDRKTGEVLWRSTALHDPAAYASLIGIEFGGQAQVVALTGQSVAGIAVADGQLLWRVERIGKTAVVPTPIFADEHVWVTSGYGVGCNLFQLSESQGTISAKMVYKNRTIKNGQGGALRIGDHVYASSGPLLVCMNWRTGKTAWRERSLNRASLSYADGQLYVRGEEGQMALVEANPESYTQRGSFEETQRSAFKSWAHPVISEGRLYLRDQDGLASYRIKAGD